MTEELISSREDICFITNKIISKNDKTRFTFEFDAWVSEEGQKIVEAEARGSDPDRESQIIFSEWYAIDEANAANDEFRRGWRPVRRGWSE